MIDREDVICNRESTQCSNHQPETFSTCVLSPLPRHTHCPLCHPIFKKFCWRTLSQVIHTNPSQFSCLGRCGNPTTYPYATFTLDKLNPYTQGSRANYSCDPGYRMIGDSDIVIHTCGVSDLNQLQWTGAMVRCVIGKLCSLTPVNC